MFKFIENIFIEKDLNISTKLFKSFFEKKISKFVYNYFNILQKYTFNFFNYKK